MNKGCWLLVDGKKVPAVRLPDGTVEPLPVEPGPADVVDIAIRPSTVEEAD